MDRYESLREKIIPILRPYARHVAVFGSYVRGEMNPDSDIDILVELKPSEERPPLGLIWFGIEEELSKILGREVDLVTENSLSPYIRPYVENEKVTIYEER
ncbi:MAG TPA: nucleotidyltransferase family protein [Anaerolineales bacterium]|nr:nucleotidyltransferase family protein [Anaerolineales bacterium]